MLFKSRFSFLLARWRGAARSSSHGILCSCKRLFDENIVTTQTRTRARYCARYTYPCTYHTSHNTPAPAPPGGRGRGGPKIQKRRKVEFLFEIPTTTTLPTTTIHPHTHTRRHAHAHPCAHPTQKHAQKPTKRNTQRWQPRPPCGSAQIENDLAGHVQTNQYCLASNIRRFHVAMPSQIWREIGVPDGVI